MAETTMRCAAFFGILLISIACSIPDIERDRVVLDEFTQLQPDNSVSYKVPPGTYKLEMTASDAGATVEWVGAPCPGAPQKTTTFSTICELTSTGQLVIKNPGFLGLGSTTSVTMKVTRFAR